MPVLLKAVLICVVLAAAIYDARYRKVPNWLSLSGVILGLCLNVYLSGWNGLEAAASGFGLALLIYTPLYLIRGMGAGDVKLMAAIGAIVGPHGWLNIFIATALVGGLVSLLAVVIKKRAHQTLLNLITIVFELAHFRRPAKADARLDIRNPSSLRMPHAISIAVGCIVFLCLTWHS
jgi:prepilin peptidase CpaA